MDIQPIKWKVSGNYEQLAMFQMTILNCKAKFVGKKIVYKGLFKKKVYSDGNPNDSDWSTI